MLVTPGSKPDRQGVCIYIYLSLIKACTCRTMSRPLGSESPRAPARAAAKENSRDQLVMMLATSIAQTATAVLHGASIVSVGAEQDKAGKVCEPELLPSVPWVQAKSALAEPG